MNFIQSIRTCFRKCFDFKGRATRSEFWWFQLFFWVVGLGMLLLEGRLGYDLSDDGLDLVLAFELILLIPVLSATARRLHDVGLTGWLQTPVLLSYVSEVRSYFPGFSDTAVVGYISDSAVLFWIAILLICIRRGSERANKYGPHPNALDMGEVFN